MTSLTTAQAWKRAPVSMFFATVAGVGHIPGAPGTYGALVGLIPVWFAATMLPPWGRWTLFLATLGLSFFWAHRAGQAMGEPDASAIVIDEVVGVWVAFIVFSTFGWLALLVGFVAFRIFDILKPPPIGLIDDRMKNGVGVVLDDVLAGIFAIPFVWVAMVWGG
ncbi:MAG: phosphatidylglycerophosphatase A [Bradymonadaceae bacterium]